MSGYIPDWEQPSIHRPATKQTSLAPQKPHAGAAGAPRPFSGGIAPHRSHSSPRNDARDIEDRKRELKSGLTREFQIYGVMFVGGVLAALLGFAINEPGVEKNHTGPMILVFGGLFTVIIGARLLWRVFCDWMNEFHPKTVDRSKTTLGILFIVVIVCLIGGCIITKAVWSGREKPLPNSGRVFVNHSGGGRTKLQLHAPYREHCFVKFVDPQTDVTVFSFFVKEGTSPGIWVPTGSYEVRYATGNTWYGEDRLFGPETRYNKIDGLQSFWSGREYTMRLSKSKFGNLRTSSMRSNAF